MSQKAIQFPGSPLPGPTMIAECIDILKSLASNRKGSARPSDVQVGEIWIDDTADPEWTLSVFDGTEDVTLLTVNTSANTIAFAGLVVGQDVQAFDADTLKAHTADLLQTVYGDEAQAHTGTDLSGLTVNRNHVEWTLTVPSQFSDVALPYDGAYVFHIYPAGNALVLAASYKNDGDLADPDSAAGEIRIVVEQYNSRKTIVSLQNMGA